MPLIEITSLAHPGVELFSALTEAQLRNRLESGKGIFIAESPKVIRARCGDIPLYTGERELLARLTGYTLTRGVLCALRRPVEKSLEEVCGNARRLVVIDGVVDTTNIGAIFRSAAALGMDGVLLTRNSCDDAQLLRPAEPPGGARVDGLGVSRAVDVAGRPSDAPPRLRFPHGGHGTDRPIPPAGCPRIEARSPSRPRDGYRGGRAA